MSADGVSVIAVSATVADTKASIEQRGHVTDVLLDRREHQEVPHVIVTCPFGYLYNLSMTALKSSLSTDATSESYVPFSRNTLYSMRMSNALFGDLYSMSAHRHLPPDIYDVLHLVQ